MKHEICLFDRKRKKGPKLTAVMAARIKAYLVNTDFNYAQISALCGGINQGRVAEVATGKRFAEVLPAAWPLPLTLPSVGLWEPSESADIGPLFG